MRVPLTSLITGLAILLTGCAAGPSPVRDPGAVDEVQLNVDWNECVAYSRDEIADRYEESQSMRSSRDQKYAEEHDGEGGEYEFSSEEFGAMGDVISAESEQEQIFRQCMIQRGYSLRDL